MAYVTTTFEFRDKVDIFPSVPCVRGLFCVTRRHSMSELQNLANDSLSALQASGVSLSASLATLVSSKWTPKVELCLRSVCWSGIRLYNVPPGSALDQA